MGRPPARILVVAGSRNTGKTHAVRSLARRWRRAGLRVAGVLSLARVVDGTKVSYTYVEIGTRRRRQYARLKPRPGSGGYDFSEAGLEFGRLSIQRAAATAGVDVLIVDEIGPLEMRGAGLWDDVRRAVARFPGRIVLTVRPRLVRRLRRLLGRGNGGIRLLTPADALTHGAERKEGPA